MVKLYKLTTVDGIVKQFTDIIQQLEYLKDTNQAKIGVNLNKIADLAEDNKKLGNEVNRAIAIRNNIEQLIKE